MSADQPNPTLEETPGDNPNAWPHRHDPTTPAPAWEALRIDVELTPAEYRMAIRQMSRAWHQRADDHNELIDAYHDVRSRLASADRAVDRLRSDVGRLGGRPRP